MQAIQPQRSLLCGQNTEAAHLLGALRMEIWRELEEKKAAKISAVFGMVTDVEDKCAELLWVGIEGSES